MKRLTGFIVILVFAVFLTACGDDESTRTFELEEGGLKTTMVYTHSGDKVTKQATENIVPYEAIGIASKEEAQELFDPIIAEFQDVDGLTHQMEYEDTRAVETLTIDYEAADVEQLEGLPGMEFSDDPNDGISMEKSAELLESQGYTEVEE